MLHPNAHAAMCFPLPLSPIAKARIECARISTYHPPADLDTYEFQLFCTTPPGAPRKPSSRHADDGAGGRDPRSSRKSKGSKQQQSSSTKQPPAAPARGGPSAFGSRAAEAEAAAAEVRAELARMRAQVKDEL